MLTLLYYRQLRGIRGYVHANLSLALIAATFIFLFGADATSDQVDHLLQYLQFIFNVSVIIII